MNIPRLTIALVTAFALTGGVGLAVAQSPSTVTICHNLQDTGEDVESDHEQQSL